MLYLLATPLGNLGDITFRSIETLKEVDIIYAEDTRRSRILLDHYGINKPLRRYDEHRSLAGSAMEKDLFEGRDIAFISDAGMPLISDPGYELIQLCTQHKLPFEVQPGPSAVLLALVNSGLSSHSFVFGGFLPRRRKERREMLLHYKEYPETLIFYETPHRILEALEDTLEVLGERPSCLLREMTKFYEEHLRLNLSELYNEIKEKPRKGEMVLVIEGAGESLPLLSPVEQIDTDVESGLKTKEIATKISKEYGMSGSDAYRLVLERINK